MFQNPFSDKLKAAFFLAAILLAWAAVVEFYAITDQSIKLDMFKKRNAELEADLSGLVSLLPDKLIKAEAEKQGFKRIFIMYNESGKAVEVKFDRNKF
ncbi:hypothetical protein HY768_03615 [candidate division TA06 bacterium]|uniref:Uncharacterized protein n=1 Tax=candidate division TA06 bacterium TaxID=2250710 RepID=A0A933MK28_UNCT6|nr:hypothetical protein [candidate division TA06 bacterium]